MSYAWTSKWHVHIVSTVHKGPLPRMEPVGVRTNYRDAGKTNEYAQGEVQEVGSILRPSARLSFEDDGLSKKAFRHCSSAP